MSEDDPQVPHDFWEQLHKRVPSLVKAIMQEIPAPRTAVPHSRWWRFLESAGGAAFIAGVVGTVVVSLLTISLQKSTNRRDFQQAWMKDIVRGAFDLSGRCIQTSEDLLLLNSEDYTLQHRDSKPDRELIQKQRSAIIDDFNAADIEWRKQRGTFGLLVGFYYRERPEPISTAWMEQVEAVNKLMGCAQRATKETECQREREAAREKQQQLKEILLK